MLTILSKPKKLNVHVEGKARERLEALLGDLGIPQTEAMRRIIEWFDEQDERFKVAILHRKPQARAAFSRSLLEEWVRAGSDQTPATGIGLPAKAGVGGKSVDKTEARTK